MFSKVKTNTIIAERMGRFYKIYNALQPQTTYIISGGSLDSYIKSFNQRAEATGYKVVWEVSK